MKPRWRIIVYVITAVLVIYLLGKWQSRQGAEDQSIIQAAEIALGQGKAYRGHMANLRAASRTHVTSARAGTIRLLTLAPTLTPVALRGEIAGVTRDWEAAFRAESTRAELAEARVATLERNLAAVITVADCRMLGLRFLPRCPSRTVALLGGVGVGIAGMLLIR